jgi:hypothetical protein
MTRALLCGAYSYGTWRTSQKEHFHNPKIPLQMRAALFMQDVIASPLLWPVYIIDDLKIEPENMTDMFVKYHNNVQQVRKNILHLPWSIADGCDCIIIHKTVGTSIATAQYSSQRSSRDC